MLLLVSGLALAAQGSASVKAKIAAADNAFAATHTFYHVGAGVHVHVAAAHDDRGVEAKRLFPETMLYGHYVNGVGDVGRLDGVRLDFVLVDGAPLSTEALVVDLK